MPPPSSPSASLAPKPTNFAFPFRGADKKPIVDEHVLHAWLAAEPTGNFAFSQSGMWHGGIHVSADGAGKHLDLEHGVRCIADGHVIAHLIHRDYLTSEIAAVEGEAAHQAQYSRAFTLVRHTLEYPANNRLTLFSLYMHLQCLEDYRRQGATVPDYWPKAFEVTEYATNRPLPDPLQGAAAPDQIGQNIRSQPSPNGTVLGVLQRGARVRISARSPDRKWGQIEAIDSGTVLPPKVGTLPGQGAQTGWVFLAKEQNRWPLAEVVSEALCDQIVTPAPIPIKAGDLIGHLGQYWPLEDWTRPNRQVHIEVFCGDALPAFLAASREAGLGITDSDKLPLLRIDQGVKLYGGPSIDEEGKDAPQTAVVQIYSQAALDAFPGEHKGPKDNAYGNGQPWWKITSGNSMHNDITGWVRNRQMPGGRVTRESPHTWQDFEVFAMSDSSPTLFGSADAWLDHALREDKPDVHDVSKLNPLTRALYRALSPMRTESDAAFELRAHGENRWMRLRASRLIPKHRSEWASKAEYAAFFETALKRIQREPYLDAEIERIKQLTWWDDVSSKVSQPFPASPELFHIHPVALVGNFPQSRESLLITLEMLIAAEHTNPASYYENLLPHINKYAKLYGVNSARRIAHFLSQAGHESKLRNSEEGLNYNPRRMREYFGCIGGKNKYNDQSDDCNQGRLRNKLWTQEAYYAYNPAHLGNYVYANRMGNGDESSGDGYKYRGRGFMQVTGKNGYRSFQEEHNKRFPDDQQDFVANPDLVLTRPEYGLESAFIFWLRNNLNNISDTGMVTDVTQIVNGGQNGYADRLARYNRVAQILGLPMEQ